MIESIEPSLIVPNRREGVSRSGRAGGATYDSVTQRPLDDHDIAAARTALHTLTGIHGSKRWSVFIAYPWRRRRLALAWIRLRDCFVIVFEFRVDPRRDSQSRSPEVQVSYTIQAIRRRVLHSWATLQYRVGTVGLSPLSPWW